MNMNMKMPLGFRFYPTEEELISFYLQRKLDGRDEGLERVIPQLYIYHLNPWDLPRNAGDLCEGEREQWFFFVPRPEKELHGGRPNRLTSSGYWKATGSPSFVYSLENRVIGEKRTMVFYQGRANSTGKKTDWKMNEYRAATTAVDQAEPSASNAAAASSSHAFRQEFSICRVYLKSKCLRAFDRRPSGGVETSSSSSMALYQSMTSSHDQHHNSRDHTISTSDIMMQSNAIMSKQEKGDHDDHLETFPPTNYRPSSLEQQTRVDNPTVEIANSSDCSSTADHANTLCDLDIEEPMWDWKYFNMF